MKNTLYLSLITALSLSVTIPVVAMDHDGAPEKSSQKKSRFERKPKSRFASKQTKRFDPPAQVSYANLKRIYTSIMVKSNNPDHEHDKKATYRSSIPEHVGEKVLIKIGVNRVYASHKDTLTTVKRKQEAILGNPHAVAVLTVPDTRSIVTMGTTDYESVGGIYTLYDSTTNLPIKSVILSWDYSSGSPAKVDKFVDTTVHLTFTKRKGK